MRRRGAEKSNFSVEMSATEIALLNVCADAGVGSLWMRGAGPDHPAWPRLLRSLARQEGLALRVEELTAPTVAQIIARAKRLQVTEGLDLVVIDYIRYIRGVGKAENRHNELAEISRSLKAMARTLSLPVIVLAQLNRQVEARAEKRPQLSDFLDCGGIEADADLAILIWRKGAHAADPGTTGETHGQTPQRPYWRHPGALQLRAR